MVKNIIFAFNYMKTVTYFLHKLLDTIWRENRISTPQSWLTEQLADFLHDMRFFTSVQSIVIVTRYICTTATWNV